jgi:hypothetical protein
MLKPIIQPIIRPVVGPWGAATVTLSAPSNLSATIDSTSGGILLTASEVTGADSYTYYVSIDGGAYTEAASGQDTDYTFTPIEAGSYSFGVTAVRGSSESAMTTTAASGLFDDVPDSEGIALMAFYEATNGDNWTNNTNWMTDPVVGNWYGVNVEAGHVTQLNLIGDANIDGDGLKHLSDLTSLTYLHLGNTSVSGDISAVSNLTSLTYLHLGTTSVSGDISAVSNLTSLTRLYLGTTSVSGDISAVSNLTSLNILHLGTTSGFGYTSTALPTWSGTNIQIYNLSLTATEVDSFLADLDTAGGTGGTLNISGTNAEPTDGSVTGVNGLAAVDSLRVKGWTVAVTGGY